jgi:hypothetical protein
VACEPPAISLSPNELTRPAPQLLALRVGSVAKCAAGDGASWGEDWRPSESLAWIIHEEDNAPDGIGWNTNPTFPEAPCDPVCHTRDPLFLAQIAADLSAL